MNSIKLLKKAVKEGNKIMIDALIVSNEWNKTELKFNFSALDDDKKTMLMESLGLIYSVEEIDELFAVDDWRFVSPY